MSVLVLGLGNILLGDEGVGVRAIERLIDSYEIDDRVEVLDGGTAGFDLLDIIAGRDHVIIVDAVSGDDAPGTVVRLVDDEVPAYFRSLMSPHQLGLCELLAVLQMVDEAPRRLTLIGIEPKCLDLGLELSPEIAARLDSVAVSVADELRSLGFAITKTGHRPGVVPPSDPPLDLAISGRFG